MKNLPGADTSFDLGGELLNVDVRSVAESTVAELRRIHEKDLEEIYKRHGISFEGL